MPIANSGIFEYILFKIRLFCHIKILNIRQSVYISVATSFCYDYSHKLLNPEWKKEKYVKQISIFFYEIYNENSSKNIS